MGKRCWKVRCQNSGGSFSYSCQPRRQQQQSRTQQQAEISSPSLGKAQDNERLRVTHEPDPESSEDRRVPVMAVHQLQSHITLTKVCP